MHCTVHPGKYCIALPSQWSQQGNFCSPRARNNRHGGL
jgi:hypothetical protein